MDIPVFTNFYCVDTEYRLEDLQSLIVTQGEWERENSNKIDLGVKAIKVYSKLLRSQQLDPLHQIHLGFMPIITLLKGVLHYCISINSC